MKYMKVHWIHSHPDEPILLFSEVDEEGWERRKVWIFGEGPPGFASATDEARSVFLSELPLPALSKIAADPQFVPEEIDREEFEKMWAEARAHTSRS